MKGYIAFFVLLICLWRGPAYCQTKVSDASTDFSVPDSPAFTVLGITPSTIVRPATPRALATSLLNGVDQSGNFQTGLSVDTVPYMLAYGNDVTLQEYRDNKVLRFFARTGLSIGTTKGASSDDKSAKIAIGLHVTIFDLGDPRMDTAFAKQLDTAADQATNSIQPLPPGATQQQIDDWNKKREDAVQKATKAIRDQRRKYGWNHSSWIIAAAPTWTSTDGTASKLGWGGAGVWTSLAYGFEQVPHLSNNLQLIVHARYRDREQVTNPAKAGEFITQSSDVFGARLQVGTSDTTGSFETAYVRAWPVRMPSQHYFRLTFAAERHLTDNLWLNVGIGGESGAVNGQNKLFVLSSLKWGISSK